jgi:hypothetical protein
VRGALGKVDGIGEIAIKAGDPDFTVHYDSSKIQPPKIVELLRAAGEDGAKVKT